MALLFALCLFFHLPDGFRARNIRPYIAQLIGLTLPQYSPGRTTYDLRRLRLKGLIQRLPGSHQYRVTPLGRRVAYFEARLYVRVLRPGWAAISSDDDGLPRPLRNAFARVDREIENLCQSANFRSAA
jgi:hypothetical protein